MNHMRKLLSLLLAMALVASQVIVPVFGEEAENGDPEIVTEETVAPAAEETEETVAPAAETGSITLEKTEYSGYPGEYTALNFVNLPESTWPDSWVSSNDSVAVVVGLDEGKHLGITFLSVGEATITMVFGEQTFTVHVTVLPLPTLALDARQTVALAQGKSVRYTFTPAESGRYIVVSNAFFPNVRLNNAYVEPFSDSWKNDQDFGYVYEFTAGNTYEITWNNWAPEDLTHRIGVLSTSPVTGITLSTEFDHFSVNSIVEVCYRLESESNAVDEVVWSVSDESLLTFYENTINERNGMLCGRFGATGTPGTVTVTATVGSVSSSCEIVIKAWPDALYIDAPNGWLSGTVGHTRTVTAIVSPEDAYLEPITWSVEDETIARIVSSDGLSCQVEGLKAGTTILTFTSGPYVNTVELRIGETIHAGETKNVTVDASSGITYSFIPQESGNYVLTSPRAGHLSFYMHDSNGNFVDTVGWADDEYLYTPLNDLQAGVAYTITAGNLYDEPVATWFKLDHAGKPTGMTLSYTQITVYEHIGAQLVALFTPSTSTAEAVTWTSSDPSVLTVGPVEEAPDSVQIAVINALKPGTATITATSASGFTATCKVTVKELPALAINTTERFTLPGLNGAAYKFTATADGEYEVRLQKTSAGLSEIYLEALNGELLSQWSDADSCGLVLNCKAGRTYVIGVSNYNQDVKYVLDLTVSNPDAPDHLHSLTKVEAKEPSYTAPGNVAHYICSVCGKLFADEAGTQELTDVSVPQLVEVNNGVAAITPEVMDKAVEEAGGSGNVNLPLNESGDVAAAQIPVAAVGTVADMGASLTVEMSGATVTMDPAALASVAQQAQGDITLSVNQVSEDALNEEQKAAMEGKTVTAVISAQLLSNGTPIGSEEAGGFGGGAVTVRIPFTPERGYAGTDYVIMYIADDGTVKEISTAYAGGCLVVKLEHFSEYAIIRTVTRAPEVVDPDNPDTGDHGILAAMVVMTACAAAYVLLTANKKRCF